MRTPPSALAGVLRSEHQARLLAEILLHPSDEFSISDLSRKLEVPLTTLHGEVHRLLSSGVLRSRDLGRNKLVQANPDNRLVAPLTDLVLASYGPEVVVAEEFHDLHGAERVLIFGSWAARFHGLPGPTPNDVDVLVVGPVDRSAVYAASDRAQERLRFPVNPTVVSAERWAAAADPLVQQIQSAPVVAVVA
jgi:hypothetical protein